MGATVPLTVVRPNATGRSEAGVGAAVGWAAAESPACADGRCRRRCGGLAGQQEQQRRAGQEAASGHVSPFLERPARPVGQPPL